MTIQFFLVAAWKFNQVVLNRIHVFFICSVISMIQVPINLKIVFGNLQIGDLKYLSYPKVQFGGALIY